MQNENGELEDLKTAIDKLKDQKITAKAFNEALKEIGNIVGINTPYFNTPYYKAKSNYQSFQGFLNKYVNKSVNLNDKEAVTKDLDTEYNAFKKQHPEINTIQPKDIVKQDIDPKTTSNIAATSPIQKSTVKRGSKDDFDVKQNFEQVNISLLNSAQDPEEEPEKKKDVIINAYNTAHGYKKSSKGYNDNDDTSSKKDRKIETLRKTFLTEIQKIYPKVDEGLCNKAFDAINSHCYGQQMTYNDYDALKQEKIGCTSKAQDSLISSANYIFDNMWHTNKDNKWRTNKDNNEEFKKFRKHVKQNKFIERVDKQAKNKFSINV